MLTVLASLQEKQAERSRPIDELRLWGEVNAQGIAFDGVEAFGFDESYLTQRELLHLRRGKACPEYNYVRLKDGTNRRLTPALRVPK